MSKTLYDYTAYVPLLSNTDLPRSSYIHALPHNNFWPCCLSVSDPLSLKQPLAHGLVAFRAFSTVRAGGKLCPCGDLFYYEVEVLHAGTCTQFGFCGPHFAAENGDSANGVGDAGPSWGVDGDRALRWHEGPKGPFGGQWLEGDVVGLACDLRGGGGGRMLVSLNGSFAPPYGVAFDLPAAGIEGGLYPALTALSGLFRCNFGQDRPFRYAPPTLPEDLAVTATGATAYSRGHTNPS